MKKLWLHGLGWIFHRPALFAMNYSREFGKILILFEVKSIIPVRLRIASESTSQTLAQHCLLIRSTLTTNWLRCRPCRANLFHFAEFNIASGEIALQKSGNGAIKERLVHHLASERRRGERRKSILRTKRTERKAFKRLRKAFCARRLSHLTFKQLPLFAKRPFWRWQAWHGHSTLTQWIMERRIQAAPLINDGWIGFGIMQ